MQEINQDEIRVWRIGNHDRRLDQVYFYYMDGVVFVPASEIFYSEKEEYLKRFSQSTFATYTSESKSNGMLMLKNDKSLSKIITSWIKEYL